MKAGKKVFLCLLFFVLAGCSGLSPAATEPAATTTSADQPSSGTVSATQQASVSDKTGAIVGNLVDETGQPITELTVFLADLNPGPTAESNIISFSLNSAKRGMTDETGRFVINDVQAGSYSLAILTPAQTTLIPDNGQQDSAIKVDVQAGQITQLGMLKMKRPR